MKIALHKNARTTPAIRAELAASHETSEALSQRFGVSVATVYKWRRRTNFQDASKRRYLFVAIDRATRWVFVQIKNNKTAANAKAFLAAFHCA